MQIGVVKQIYRYAVKSMAGERLDECTVGLLGIPGDRGWALRDETTGEITNGKNFPVLMQCAARYREAPPFFKRARSLPATPSSAACATAPAGWSANAPR